MYQQSQLPNMLIFSDFEGDMDSSQRNSQDSLTFFKKNLYCLGVIKRKMLSRSFLSDMWHFWSAKLNTHQGRTSRTVVVYTLAVLRETPE